MGRTGASGIVGMNTHKYMNTLIIFQAWRQNRVIDIMEPLPRVAELLKTRLLICDEDRLPGRRNAPPVSRSSAVPLIP